MNFWDPVSSAYCMKKLMLVSALLFGAVAASHAGVHVNLGIGLPLPPLPPLPGVVIGAPAPAVVGPPVCAPGVVVAPYAYGTYGYCGPRYYGGYGRYHHYGGGGHYGHGGWNNGHGGWGHGNGHH